MNIHKTKIEDWAISKNPPPRGGDEFYLDYKGDKAIWINFQGNTYYIGMDAKRFFNIKEKAVHKPIDDLPAPILYHYLKHMVKNI